MCVVSLIAIACKVPVAELTLDAGIACGNVALETGEVCDDGNTTSGDGCSSDCASDETCGNGVVDITENCDDSNTRGGDGCSADCTSDETCGNGVTDVVAGETCDDANGISGDGCSNTCQSNESCGNGIKDINEACDSSNQFTPTCDPDCTLPVCGDGTRNAVKGEECDDGNTSNADACDAMCRNVVCGNARIEGTEQCDDGNSLTTDSCIACRAAVCGDGYHWKPMHEDCDDGNMIQTDSCLTGCISARCGDGVIHAGVETCDDGNAITTDACPSCQAAVCGDGFVRSGVEACDDGVNALTSACPACQNPYASCQALRTAHPTAPNGVYTLDAGSGTFLAYCEMTADGGGWTLAVKADGSKLTFQYDDPIWENTTLYAPDAPDFDRNEAKLETWNRVPFTQLRVGLEYPIGSGTLRWIIVPLSGERLGDLFAPGVQMSTMLGRDTWKTLVGGSSLQVNCNLEGTNIFHDYTRVRLGMISNNEVDCSTPDSRLGIGGGGTVCGIVPTESAGNSSCYGGDNGDVELTAFGYIMVR